MAFDCREFLDVVCREAKGRIHADVKVTDHEGNSALDPLIEHCALNGWLTYEGRGRVRLTPTGKQIAQAPAPC